MSERRESRASDYVLPPGEDALLSECEVTMFTASGPGGQHRNRSRTAVRLRHRPTGLVVIGRRERSQRQNLRDALARLRQRLEERLRTPKPRKRTKATAAARKRRLQEKRRRGDVKRYRKRPDSE